MSAGRRRTGLLLCTLLLGVAVGGCTSDGDDPSPLPPARQGSVGFRTPEPTATPRPAPTEVASDDAVDYGYVTFWVAFMNAQVDGTPDDAELTQRGTGQALAFARESITAYKTNGWVRTQLDGYRINSQVAERTATTARVSDVQDWSRWPLLVRATGKTVEGSTPTRQCITADLVRQEDRWVVSTLTFTQNAC